MCLCFDSHPNNVEIFFDFLDVAWYFTVNSTGAWCIELAIFSNFLFLSFIVKDTTTLSFRLTFKNPMTCMLLDFLDEFHFFKSRLQPNAICSLVLIFFLILRGFVNLSTYVIFHSWHCGNTFDIEISPFLLIVCSIVFENLSSKSVCLNNVWKLFQFFIVIIAHILQHFFALLSIYVSLFWNLWHIIVYLKISKKIICGQKLHFYTL